MEGYHGHQSDQNGLVIFRETIENSFDLILRIKSFTKQGKFIKSSSKTLEVFIDLFTTFLTVLDLLTNLFDMSMARFGVSQRESCPDLGRNGEDWLDCSGDVTEQSTIDQTVLSFP